MRWVSLYDLVSIPEIKEVILNDDLGTFYEILWEAGFDINKEIEYDPSYCRSMIDHKVICFGRFVASERDDDEWRDSGNMTLETRMRIAGRKDATLLKEMEALSRESNFTGDLCDSLESFWGESAPSQAIIEISM